MSRPRPGRRGPSRALPAAGLLLTALATLAASAAGAAPYPRSRVITRITWDTPTYRYAGVGGDIWPVTSGADGRVYTAWGDGVVVCPAYTSYGTAAVAGGPGTTLVDTGCGPPGDKHGKLSSLLAIGGVLYAYVNLQSPPGPHPDHAVWRSATGARPGPGRPGCSPPRQGRCCRPRS